ncbi:hypothetical protein MKD41_16220 [Lutibacter sp. A64]|uniref:hypothetical protein n=1 Tax=Lutibacter sp. A64 TaxID=2918526 RepID=UPI001F05B02E|nr:hypothetical protein [Lutibacter sp. A64]UMB53859.1 hypothetical protein MKD41_16220 [Lutibacter sp. A64]
MNFSKKNHEYKIINMKRVSKKIILSIVFVFAISPLTQVSAAENKQANCGADAFELQTFLEAEGYDMEFANEMANDWYEACLYVTG